MLIIVFFTISCRKDNISNYNPINKNVESSFFNLKGSNDPILLRVVNELKSQQKLNSNFIKTIVDRNGYPLWDKIKYPRYNDIPSTNINPEDTIVYIPLAIEGEEKVTAFFIAIINNHIELQLHNKFDYKPKGYDTLGISNANRFAMQFMVLDYEIFGHKDFIIYDHQLLKNFEITIGVPIKDKIVHIERSNTTESRGGWVTIEYDVCTYTRYLECSCNGCCCPDGSCSLCQELCWHTKPDCKKVSFLVYLDEGNSGGGGGTTPPETGGGGGSPNAPVQICNPSPYISNGLPPCPKGLELGWEPFEFSELIYHDFAPPPFVWNYNGDDGTTFTDPDPLEEPDFEFDITDNYENLYPRFTNMVKNLKTFVKNNPKVLNALQKWSGFTKQQILNHLTYGQGPKIKIEEMSGRYAWYKKRPGENTLRVRASYVRGLEAAFLESTKEGTAFLLAVSILHEYIHFGTTHNNISEGKYEFGSGFELDAFNVIVEDTNANEIVIKFSEHF